MNQEWANLTWEHCSDFGSWGMENMWVDLIRRGALQRHGVLRHASEVGSASPRMQPSGIVPRESRALGLIDMGTRISVTNSMVPLPATTRYKKYTALVMLLRF